VCVCVCVCVTTTFSVQLEFTRPPPPHTTAWEKPQQTGSEAPGHFLSPFKMGLLFPRGSTEKPWAAAAEATATTTSPATSPAHANLSGLCSDTEFGPTLFRPPDQPQRDPRTVKPFSTCQLGHRTDASCSMPTGEPAASHTLHLILVRSAHIMFSKHAVRSQFCNESLLPDLKFCIRLSEVSCFRSK